MSQNGKFPHKMDIRDFYIKPKFDEAKSEMTPSKQKINYIRPKFDEANLR
jgi:hypothetical protein